MPFAGFKDFAACTAAQIAKGKSKESADKICGKLKATLEKAEETISKAKLSTKEKNALPDSAFLIIDSKGRHFPVKDKDGNVDANHVRNALARIPDSKVSEADKTKAKNKATKLLNGLKKAYDANVQIEKSRLVIKPKNKAGNIVSGIQETGSASMSIQRAGTLDDVRGVTKPKKKVSKENMSGIDTGTDSQSETASANDYPPSPGRSVDEDVTPSSMYCSYCGAKNPTEDASDDAATGIILSGSKFDGENTDRDASPGIDDGNVQLVEKAISIKLTKSDQPDEEHYVLGVVLEPETEDSQRDIYSEEEIRKSAHMFMENYGHIGLQHNGVIDDRAKILESYIAPCTFELNGQTIKKGTWLLGARIQDNDLWTDIKKGSLTGWSIGGSAIRTEECVT